MALADTAKLAIDLSLTGNARTGLAGVSKQLAGIDRQAGSIGKGFKTLGAGIGVAFRNAAFIGIAALGGLTALITKSVREGQEAAKVQTIYANAIANSGKVSTQYVAILNKQQTALMNLAGIDDELIKSSQTRLIQMGLTGEQTAKIIPLVLDFAKATGIDLETATKLVGKSINGNTGALARYGVQIDKTKAKVDPFAATQDALNSKFAGTTKALSGSLEARLGAFRENMANIREELGIKLLPALTRIVDVAGKDLVPAFGKFIDRIMPSLISGIDKFASLLENGGAERGIKAITDALGPMVDLLKIAAAPIKAIVSAFLSLPPQVQGVLVAGFAVNKLSGGLIGQGVGEIAKGVFQRGGSPATPLYVSDVAGGAGLLTKGGGGKWAAVGTLIGGAFAVIAAAAIAEEIHNAISLGGGLEGRNKSGELLPGDKLVWPWGPKNTPKWVIDGPFGPINVLGGDSTFTNALPGAGKGSLTGAIGDAIAKLFQSVAKNPAIVSAGQALLRKGVVDRATAAGRHPTEVAIQRTLDKNAAHVAEIQQRIKANTGDTVSELVRVRLAVLAAGVATGGRWSTPPGTPSGVPSGTPGKKGGGPGVLGPGHHLAGGGPAWANQDYLIGERGPEILRMGSRSGTVMPNGGSPPVIHVAVAVPTRDININRVIKSRMGPSVAETGAI